MRRFLVLFAVLALVAIGALAQDDSDTNDNGFLTNLLQNQLSAPGRQIGLSGVSGALSSQARIQRVTISDDQGVWFEVDNVELDWSRLALLRGRVSVNRLSAERIAWLRQPNIPPQPRKIEAEAQPFSLPELPVSIQVDSIHSDHIVFDEAVFGRAADLSLDGSLSLADGTLDTNLDIQRLDQPGGSLTFAAGFSNSDRQMNVDLDLHEPQGGVIASLLQIEGEPAIDLSVSGAGPLDDVDVDFALDAAGERIVDGLIALRSTDTGLGFNVDFSGGLAPLIPPDYRDFFAGESHVRIQGTRGTEGALTVNTIDVSGAVLDLNGSVATSNDNFLQTLTLSGTLGNASGPPVRLPAPGTPTFLQSATLHVNFGETSRWSGFVVLDRLRVADIGMEDVTLRLGGLAQNLQDPAKRNVTISVEGLATGVWSPDPDVAQALGSRIDLFADAALPAGAPIQIHQFQISGNGLSIFSAGELDNLVYTGRNAVRISDIGVFGGVASRPLSGAVNLRANGSVSPLAGAFDLTLDGSTTDLKLGDPRLDALLAGETTIAGHAVRDQDGIRTDGVRIENPQLAFASDGVISSRRTDITFDASLADLALIDPRLQGAVNARGQAQGDGLPVAVTASISVPSGQVMGRELTNARVAFDGEVRSASDFSGTLDGSGGLDGLVLSLAGQADVSGQERSLSGLEVRVGPNRLTGDLQQSGSGPAAGTVTLDAPDIAPLAALALTEASGTVNAQLDLIANEGRQDVSVDAQTSSLVVGATRVGQLDLTANVGDALNVPMIDGRLSARDIAAGGIEIATLGAEATQTDPTHMKFSAQSRLVIGTLADISGELERLDDGFAVNLDTLRLRQQDVSATLTTPATVSLRGGAVELTPLTLDFGTGRLTAQGKMNDYFDIDVDITDMPLALGNAIKPDMALAGVVNGSARVTGPRNTPNVSFDVTAADVAASATRTAGLPPVTLTATGTTSNGDLALDAMLASGNGLSADARGVVPLGSGNLDLTVDLNAFPLALVDRIAGNQGLQGTISGQANVTGPLADPAVTFDVRGDGLTANPLSASGLPPVNLSANGAYRGQVVTIESASASGAGGLDLTGSGRIPLTGSGLDVNVSGTAPLAMANPLLEQRAAQAEGTLRIDATARGSLTAPQLGGNVSLSGGTFVDPGVNIRLEGIALDAGLEGDAAVLRNFSANVATGGRISADGRVSINSAAGFPADLNARIDNVRYTDGAMVSTQVSGQLGLQGPLVGGGGLLSGQIDLGRTEISISEGLGGSSAVLEQVNHVNTPQGVQTTLDRAGLGAPATEETTPSQPSPGIGLDIQINAPNQIFVRGRGLDVEVGGSVRIQGTTNDIQPVGQFDLRRGRLLVLTQRIEFDEGSVQLVGNLDPLLNFVAHTRSGDVTAIVTVTGRASAPEIGFSSEPPLPEDEVLARLLFNRAAEDLSPFQLAQLAAAAAELAGAGGGPGVMSQLRNATGLDDLDVITDEQGDTALRAGKYLSENIYLDVQTDTAGMSQAEINLDISDSVTARGSVASDGNTTIGLFYERDF